MVLVRSEKRHIVPTRWFAILVVAILCLSLSCTTESNPSSHSTRSFIPNMTLTPPLGWNSYDCWFYDINESVIIDNLNAFEKKLKPAGYEYFVLDDQWQYDWDNDTKVQIICIDSFGRNIPNPKMFPKGLQPLIDLAHSKGIKFGVWLIRGAPKIAINRKLTVKGTTIPFSQILDTTVKIDSYLGHSSWHGTSAFKENGTGIQEYYNSVFELLAEWGIDFVKYDYITHSKEDMAAVITARNNCGRDIVISFSSGCGTNTPLYPVYKQADMVRITGDIWDNRESLECVYSHWEFWQPYAYPGFWLDLDMIPFGSFPVYNRTDSFSLAQKKTFMTQRALAASPLFMGGSLPETDSISIALITDQDMLDCNQNGICGHLIKRTTQYDIWGTASNTDPAIGWVGIFNRNVSSIDVSITISDLGLDTTFNYQLYDIWEKIFLPQNTLVKTMDPDGVLFIRYRRL